MSDVEIDYEYLTQKALKGVLRDVLEMTRELGEPPGEHHFYIEFLTDAPGVEIPDFLRESYPERMTIVLQHQFANLAVSEEAFEVTLWFKGREARLRVPFEAVASFADPSVQFGMRFLAPAEAREAEQPESAAPAPDPDETKNAADAGAEVVSIDAFRKK
ncbi:SspB family protein [Amphiplicatus metriothermophilus]|uniref:Stringent starvation protein B n=1 Tax=Amphiplicatus metriothermophilus TaxID=1519374 RepID=A0A239PQB0_9PROT|nr:ClpXP protease specificity-enhancing factor SspB [Amphiplicatus metriothermophilus]MBB5518352.1 hypothetical protein [Amphiplicatus metriothermophilus]SNT72479.1 hypothetical protein SAMN06297382_1525 [Amphiplicatus metriothermophilus]